MDLRAVMTIAGQELKIGSRSRWTIAFAGVLAVLALAISYFGLATQDIAGFQGFRRTVASLLNLVLYLIPLVGLTMGSLSLTGERGAQELLFAQPVSRSEVLCGKALGLFASIAAATLFGFGAAGVVIGGQTGPEGVAQYLVVAGLALVLALIFLGLGLLAAVVSGSRAKALGAGLVLWFFFVLFYDLAVLGATLLLDERSANRLIFGSLFANPVDLVRVAVLMASGGETSFGAAGAALLKFLGGRSAAAGCLALSLAAWIILPLWFAIRQMKRRDL